MVLNPGSETRPHQLRRLLAAQLPAVMVPATITALDALPLTPNGKIDRRALPDPGASPDTTEDASAMVDASPYRGGLDGDYVAPRDDVERRLAEIWQQQLGLGRIGVNDDFFDLGGHSLAAVRVFARIQAAFQVDLSISTLSGRQRLRAALASWSRSTASGESVPRWPGSLLLRAPMAAMAPDPRRRKVRPGAGAMRGRRWCRFKRTAPLPRSSVSTAPAAIFLNFRNLARRLGTDQPFYGFQARGVNGSDPPVETVEEMAALYLSALRRVRPTGPYMVGGFSGGGVVAFEMAQQLRRAGHEVALVALIDTFSPLLGIVRPGFTGMLGARVKASVKRGLVDMLRWQERFREELSLEVDRRRIRWHLYRGHRIPSDLRETYLTDAYMAAQRRYRPGPNPCRVALFRAEGSHTFGADLGWAPLVPNGLLVHDIPGDHDSLMLEPNVTVLVSRLRATLADERELHVTQRPADRAALQSGLRYVGRQRGDLTGASLTEVSD